LNKFEQAGMNRIETRGFKSTRAFPLGDRHYDYALGEQHEKKPNSLLRSLKFTVFRCCCRKQIAAGLTS